MFSQSAGECITRAELYKDCTLYDHHTDSFTNRGEKRFQKIRGSNGQTETKQEAGSPRKGNSSGTTRGWLCGKMKYERRS